MNRRHYSLILTLLGITCLTFLALAPKAQAARSITFPVIGSATFTNDFNAARSGGRTHGATDIFAPKHRKLVAAVDGVVTYVGYPQPSYGYIVIIRDNDNYTYKYIHINNDNPGTDDGSGGGMHAYAPDMKAGNRVVKGQFIGYLGDSGNAETTPPHLHFEIFNDDDERVNPYQSLVEARHLSAPVDYPELASELLPFGTKYKDEIHIAMGNVDGDAESETVVGTGPDRDPHVRVFDANKTRLAGFLAYNQTFQGGVDVATGDVDGDGRDEIITAAGIGGGAHIKVFELDGNMIGSFGAYQTGFKSAVNVSSADVDGDGTDEIITAPGAGAGPSVKIFQLDGTRVGGFLTHDSAFRGGVDIAGGNVVPEVGPAPTVSEIVAAAGAGGGPTIKVFQANGTQARSFVAYTPSFRGGVRVSTGNVVFGTAYDEVMTIPASLEGPKVKLYDVSQLERNILYGDTFLEEWWVGSYDIAAGRGAAIAAAHTHRRATVRNALDD